MLAIAYGLLSDPNLEPALRPLRNIKTFMLWAWVAVAGAVFLGLVVGLFLSRRWRERMRRKRITPPRTPDRIGEEALRQEG